MFIISILVLELGLWILIDIRERCSWSKEKSSIYKDSLWAKQYFNDFEHLEKEYYPFYEWRRKEYKSEFINISKDGIRKTWNPECKERVNKVFVFGGSTIWGTGARDEWTIPSLLSKNLNKLKSTYFVVNFGDSGYVLTQEIIILLLELRQGNFPDYVIFYDGVNDVLSTFENGNAGLIHHYDRWKMKLDMDAKIFNAMTKEAIMDYSKIYYYIDYIINTYIKREQAFNYTDGELKKLAQQIIEEYRKNIDLVERLSQSYGFRYIFLWQPVLFTVKPKTEEEQEALAVRPRGLEQLYIYTYELAEKLNARNFYNLSHIFDGKTETFFIDYCHIGEKQNQIVADTISELMKK